MANKTVPGTLRVDDYMAQIEHPQRRADCEWLLETLTRMTGDSPVIWGGTLKNGIVGFGDYHYKYDSGREGDFMRIGFANRSQHISIYILPGYQDFSDELSRLGLHKKGKSCLNLKRLSDVDTDVLEEMLQKGLAIMDEKYPR